MRSLFTALIVLFTGLIILLIVFVTLSAINTTRERKAIDADIASGKYKKTNMFIVQRNKKYTVYINNKEEK
jgi:predicted membrane-bound spermidine synthase